MIRDTQHLFLITELLVSLFGAIMLFALWSTIKVRYRFKLSQEVPIKRVDLGLQFFALAVLVWALLAFLNLYYLEHNETWIKWTGQNMLSILNSMFLIFGLYYLDNSPSYIYNNKSSSWRIITVLVLLSIVSFVIALSGASELVAYNIHLSAIPDLLLSAVLTWFLVVSLYRTFSNRKMPLIAIISVFSVCLLFVSQFSEVIDWSSNKQIYNLMKIVAKSSIISIFLILGTSWVMELGETPAISDMKIHFTDWNQLQLSIPSKSIINQQVEFGNKTTQFNNLLKFAIRRKFAPENNMCIEIVRGGELQSQTYLSRIVENLNSILCLDDDHMLSRNDLFTFIGQGKYRLRFLPSHIEIDNALFNEFVHNTDNELYMEFYPSNK